MLLLGLQHYHLVVHFRLLMLLLGLQYYYYQPSISYTLYHNRQSLNYVIMA